MVETFDKRAGQIKSLVEANKGVAPEQVEKTSSFSSIREGIMVDMREAVHQLDAMRQGSKDRRSADIDFATYAKLRWGFAAAEDGSVDNFYRAIGLNPGESTIQSLMTMPDFDEGYRWLLPEVIRGAVRLGMRRAPLYPNVIAAEESVSMPQVTMPSIKMSDAMATKIGETESIPVGTVTFGQKVVGLQKLGTGLKISDEVQQYVPLNILSIYLQDVGVKLNMGLDAMAVDVLINGDQDSGVNAAAVIGVDNTTNGHTYKDLLRAWIRMGMLGRLPQSILSNENPALSILLLTEFRNREYLTNPQSLNLRTPVPQTANYDIHGAMPDDDQIMLIDATSALIKLNSAALRVESERIASRQINGTYVSVTTGFANLFNDARLIIDKGIAFSGAGFPSYMNPAATMAETFK